MNVQPIFYLEHLTDDEIAKHECSDRIWLPKNEFDHWARQTQPGVLSVIGLTNSVEQMVVGAPFSSHDVPNTIYVPYWMFQRLDADQTTIHITHVEPGLCTQITMQPYTSEHLRAEDPLEALRDAFENYSCIQAGFTIPLWVGGVALQVDINSTLPAGVEPLCIRNGTLDLELLRPLDYQPTPPTTRPGTPIPPMDIPMVPADVITHVPMPSREERRNRAAAAAMARMNAP